MAQISIEEIIEKAKECARTKKDWHFHIFTPECLLNQSNEYVLMLENTTDPESFVHYSSEPMMAAGKELVKLLSGDKIVDSGDKLDVPELSAEVKKILTCAKELNAEGKLWHHHLLFPNCVFNQDKPHWVIIFEDTESGERLKSLSESEPKTDLKMIETLFYSQK